MENRVSEAFSGGLFAVTLITSDMDTSNDFYGGKLGLALVFSDEVSAVYKCGQTLINLLAASAAKELVAPASIATGGTGSGVGAVYTLRVADVDGVVAELTIAGVEILNGPIDRPWGVRTASFADPSGHVWEVANHK
jgi:catechol 2,3-dioxygenase-like lactoylglutathione lyase family enzyme